MFHVLKLLDEIEKAGPDRGRVIDEQLAEVEQAAQLLRSLKRLISPATGLITTNAAPSANGNGLPVIDHSLGKVLPQRSVGSLGLTAEGSQRRLTIARKIASDGPIRFSEAEAILTAMGCPRGSIANVLKSSLFQQESDKTYGLTELGHQAINALPPSAIEDCLRTTNEAESSNGFT